MVLVTAKQHVDNKVKLPAAQPVKSRGAFQVRVEFIQIPAPGSGHGNDDLRQHVQRVVNGADRLQGLVMHGPGQHGGFNEIPGMGWIDGAAAGGAHLMPGSPDALNGAGNGAG